jgi:hypothetical protein
MATAQGFTRIPLQVGSELRITNRGEIKVSNPTVELEPAQDAADAILGYRFDASASEHVLHLLEPTALRRRSEP